MKENNFAVIHDGEEQKFLDRQSAFTFALNKLSKNKETLINADTFLQALEENESGIFVLNNDEIIAEARFEIIKVIDNEHFLVKEVLVFN